MNERLGFIGTGAITAAVVAGFVRAGVQPGDVVVSPRNHHVSADLAERFAGLKIGQSNQDVVDRSDVLFLAIRPQVAADVLRPLRFRHGQLMVSFIAMLPVEDLRRYAPSSVISRAVPLPMVSKQLGPVIVLSDAPKVIDLLGTLGVLIRAADERQLDVLLASTAIMSSYFGALADVDLWLRQHGVADSKATQCVAAMAHGLGVMAKDQQDQGLDTLRSAFATPGGINEQLFKGLRALGMKGAIAGSLEHILARLRPSEGASKTSSPRPTIGEK